MSKAGFGLAAMLPAVAAVAACSDREADASNSGGGSTTNMDLSSPGTAGMPRGTTPIGTERWDGREGG